MSHRISFERKSAVGIHAVGTNMLSEASRCEEKYHAFPLRDSGPCQPGKSKSYRLSRCTNHLAQKAMVFYFEAQPSVRTDERPVARQTPERRNETLLDILRCHRMQLFEECGALAHQLADDVDCLRRIFPDECAELSAANEKGFGIIRRICICDVNCFRTQALDTERLARDDDGGYESPSVPNAIAQDHMAAQHDRKAIRGRTPLVYLKA